MKKSYEYLTTQIEPDGLGICTFNRPEKRNALSETMVNEIHDLLGTWEENPDVKVVIFTGAGEKAFVSGADIAELKERTRKDALRQINSGLFFEIERFPKPTIAAINGYALGGGLELALACDLRICSRDAKMGQPEVGLGIIPAAGGCYRLPRIVGLGRAKYLIFSGEIIDAQTAFEIGLVNHVATADFLEETRTIARKIAQQSPRAVQMAKSIMLPGEELTVHFMKLESEAQAVLFEDEEKHRRMQAFLDHQNPNSLLTREEVK